MFGNVELNLARIGTCHNTTKPTIILGTFFSKKLIFLFSLRPCFENGLLGMLTFVLIKSFEKSELNYGKN